MENKNQDLVFSEQWFEKHQGILVWLASSWFGELIFRFKKFGHYLEKGKPIYKITPNSVAQVVGVEDGQLVVTEQFFVLNDYAQRIYQVFKPFWWLLHFFDWVILDQRLPDFSFGFSTLTQFPDGGSTTIDGRVYRQPGGSETFATIRAGAGTGVDTGITDGFAVLLESLAVSNQFNSIRRFIALFNTSSIGSSSTVTAATASLVIKTSGVLNQFGGAGAVGLVGSTPASNTSLATSDYGNIASTRYCTSDLALSGMTANSSTYTDWALNATGLSNVPVTGITKLAWALGWDIDNSFGGSWAGSNDAGFDNFFAFNGSLKPKLVVTYTIITTTSTTITTSSSTTTTSSSTSSSSSTTTTSSSTSTSVTTSSTLSTTTTLTPVSGRGLTRTKKFNFSKITRGRVRR